MSAPARSPTPSSSKSISPSPEAADVEAVGGGKWKADEDARLQAAVAELGDKGGRDGTWKEISKRVGGGRTDKSCKKRWSNALDPSVRKGRWTAEEDAVLLEKFAQFGTRWYEIAAFIPGRKADQVAKRYRDTLDPSLTAQAPWTAEEDAIILAAHAQVGPLWTLICSKVGPGRSGMHVRNRWRTLTRPTTPNLARKASDGRPGSRERSSEAGPSRRPRSTTSASAAGRSGSPASRVEAQREDLPSPSTVESAASPFDFDKYYAAIASPAPHVPPSFGEAVNPATSNPPLPFTEAELAPFRSSLPPPPNNNGNGAMDWTALNSLAPPVSAPPSFPSPLLQVPMTHDLVMCTHCHGSGFVASSTDFLGLEESGASLGGGVASAAGWPGMDSA
ncbi:Homeodomain-like protein [Leucosporidium creatinivorum]|uniref:Homeodomain-like protein n=1 Tax=Leucosporidium creatinivorum TaxID=106004 RepID=A0A1Y2G2A8_9BASI|nr:Homeodomain-like protein [Leucosporidium creatinivorum]